MFFQDANDSGFKTRSWVTVGVITIEIGGFRETIQHKMMQAQLQNVYPTVLSVHKPKGSLTPQNKLRSVWITFFSYADGEVRIYSLTERP